VLHSVLITAFYGNILLVLNCSGWLSRKQLSNSDAVFTTFESVWPDLYRYVVQSLDPKMGVRFTAVCTSHHERIV